MKYNRTAILLAAGLTFGFAAHQARAQHALDGNLQAGSGGVNAPSQSYNYSGGNNVVTGNAGGGRDFRGDVGYRAAGEFRGAAGSDDLYQFRANSISTGQPGYVPNQPVYRTNTGPSVGDLNLPGVTQSQVLLRQSGGANNAYQLNVNPGAALGRSSATTGLNTTGLASPGLTTPGVLPAPDGTSLQQNLSSPLLGVRSTARSGPTGANPNTNSWNLPTPPVAVDSVDHTGLPRTSSLGDPALLDNRVGTPPSVTNAQIDSMVFTQPNQPSYAQPLNNAIDARASRGGIGPNPQTLDRRVAEIQAASTGPQSDLAVSPGQDAYMRLLNRERSRVSTMLGQTPASSQAGSGDYLATPPTQDPDQPQLPPLNSYAAPAPLGAQPMGAQPAPQPTPGAPTGEAPAAAPDHSDSSAALLNSLMAPTQPQRSAASDLQLPVTEPAPTAAQAAAQAALEQQQQHNARLQARGLPLPTLGNAPTDTNAGNAATNQNPRLSVDDATAALKGLDSQQPRADYNFDINNLVDARQQVDFRNVQLLNTSVTSLSVDRQGRINEQLREAEVDLAAGRYAEAEQRFRLVEGADPRNPLPTVGKVHAQLGAAMFRTAGTNLRLLFNTHPQYAAVRYDLRLLPTSKRMSWIREQLDNAVRNTRSDHAGLLMAYLGYQTNSPELVQAGLEAMPAHDELTPLLRRAWLGQQ